MSIFLKPNGNHCVYYPLNISRNAHLGNIQSRDALRPIMCELKFLMDYNDELKLEHTIIHIGTVIH